MKNILDEIFKNNEINNLEKVLVLNLFLGTYIYYYAHL
jgi:hypothetical protein